MRFGRRTMLVGVLGLVVTILGAAAGSWLYARLRDESFTSITVTAQFDSAAGLYENNVVAVLGIPVGKVNKVTPHSDFAEVEFTIDRSVRVPADVQAVTVLTSILTDRLIELTPPYHDGPVLKSHDTIPLIRTKTPIAFDRVLAAFDKLAKSLRGDGAGSGPVADIVDVSAGIADGNGPKIKDALGELSQALQLGSDQGAKTREQLTTIISDISSLVEAAARNDATLRGFGSAARQLSQILADEDFGTGSTGRLLEQAVEQAGSILQANRDNIRQAILNGNTGLQSVVDRQREVAELFDVAPLAVDNLYNTVDRANGALRVHFLLDRQLFDSQGTKEICNLMHLRQLGCSTGTLQDYGPDFGLTYVLDGLAAMGQQ